MDIYKCTECGEKFEATKYIKRSIKGRKAKTGEIICKECYKKYGHGSIPASYYPEELRQFYNDDVWPYEIVMKYKDILKTKKKVGFICMVCGQKGAISFNYMIKRKICGTKPICGKCANKYAASSLEKREANSKAQFIAQNRPEVLEKQREAQARLMKEDPLYIEKRRSNNFISGSIDGIKFDSSWELFFIIYCLDKNIAIKRYGKRCYYKDSEGRKRAFYPDFIVTENGVENIVEIKGNKCQNVKEKVEAAIELFGDKFKIYMREDLRKMGIEVRSYPYMRDCYIKAIEEHKTTFVQNKALKNVKKTIGMEKWQRWQK
jgi:protein-arginine kinase activator protein McsA